MFFVNIVREVQNTNKIQEVRTSREEWQHAQNIT